ncbi:START domain protein (macronuclear) [Tetrahymena thermophila SB210]|uniref:START domain protein n=1 Tax=Tetrahymena thermophila (strain SB210) TaxID=312017 RepID=Q22DB1_TETTS|nr:START domain protein [Tetrahymena thermophila SB210]EAR83291.1 START domain protein [Tetrahymena thermophila SB210]|eukprot:XP_001030954.1 START domain protein [Tetrahymena thermophila SB210]
MRQMSVQEPEIAGYLQIKRKMFWVIRYAEIINGNFYYYYNKGDTKPRGVFALYGSKSNEMQTSDNENIIQFVTSKQQQSQRLLIRCDNNQDHRNWLIKLNFYSQNQSQNPQNLIINGRNNGNDILSSMQLQQNQQNSQNTNLYERSDIDSVVSSSTNLKLNNGNQRQNDRIRGDQLINDSQNIKFVYIQNDTCKSNPYIFDNEFLTNKQGGSGSNIALEKNLQTALDNFKDCKILSDIDKNIRLYCSESAVNSICKQQYSKNNSSSSPNDQERFFTQLMNQYFDSPQMKMLLTFVTVIISLLVYQSLQILDTKNLIITILVMINFILVPLFARKLNEMTYQSQKKKMKQIKQGCIAEYFFPHNPNEILFVLTKNFEKRKEWQMNVQKCELKPLSNSNEYITTFYRRDPEVFIQNVIRDKDVVYLTEESTTHNFLRIFQIPCNSQIEDGTNVKYYFYSPYTKISDMNNNPNSPLLLYGINFYLKQLKRNPFSPLFAYYSQSLGFGTQRDNSQQQPVEIEQPKSNTQENKIVQNKNVNIASQSGQENKKVQKEEQQDEEESKVDAPQNSNQEPQLLEGEAGQKYNKKIKELIDLMKNIAPLDPKNKWKDNDIKAEYQTHTKIDEETGNVMSRGEVKIMKSAQEIVDFIQDASKRKSWDEMFKEGKEVQALSENCRIEHNVFKGIFPVSDRDFCLLQISLKIGDIHYLLATSVDHPSVPEVSKPVRATLKIGGWLVEPISPTQSKCIYITCSNLNGSIAQSIKDMVAKKQSMNSVKLKKSIEKK